MNEILFLIQIFFIITFVLFSLKQGKVFLTTSVTVQALIANLFVLKQITLFGFEVTASDAFAIGSLLGLNMLQEYFTKEDAQKAMWICFFFMLFFTLISQLHLLYQPNSHDTTQEAFLTLLSASPRFLIASMCAFLLVQQIDIRFFTFLKLQLPKINFSIRATIALIVSQFLDTALFSFMGLYGLVISVFDIIFFSFTIKLLVIFCFTPFMRWAKS